MNDYKDFIDQILNHRIYGNAVDSIWIDETGYKDMSYSYSRGYYQDTRGDEVATAVLEAYANGVEFETLIKKNKTVRQYWYQIQTEKAKAEQSREKEKERIRKLAEKRRLEEKQKAEAMTKLSQEELEAFGLVKKGKR